ncbi:MAG TPA: hypothetical protein VE130_09775 [Nitrososphaeraceae archaeon]|nr:hypothetical protein [Nitrososphaeraceae archaeon]
MLDGLMLIILFSFILVVVTHFLSFHELYAHTYNEIWWIGGNDPSTAAGNVRVVYTYPNQVHAGDKFDVGITLEYIPDVDQNSDWISFPVIIPLLREIHTNDTYYFDTEEDRVTTGIDQINTKTTSLDIVKRGDEFSKNLTLTAPSENGTYMFGIVFDSFFGPGSGTDYYRWNSTEYYNATWRDDGMIDPKSESPPINIINYSSAHNPATLIRVGLQEPYGRFNDTDILLYNVTTNSIDRMNLNDGYSESYVNPNSSYTLTAPRVINMAENEARALFLRWSDGYTSPSRDIVPDNQFSEYYAIYRPQYYLKVESDVGNPKGAGWYNASSQAEYSVRPIAGLWSLQTFNHWKGDLSWSNGQDINIPSGFVSMDGPKVVKAVWVHDLTYLGILSGGVVIVTSVAGAARFFWLKRRSAP